MRARAASWMLVLVALMLCAVAALPAYALPEALPGLPSLPSGAPSSVPSAASVNPNAIRPPETCDGYVGLTHHLAGCIRDTINASAEKFFDEIYPFFKRAIAALLTLAVVIYGVMFSVGLVEKTGRDTFVLIIKISAIAGLVTSSPLMFHTVTRAMDGAAAAVVSYAPPSGMADNAGSDYSQSICMRVMMDAQANAAPGKPIITPWLGIDCLIDTLVGIKMPPTAGATRQGSETYFNTLYDNADSSTKPNTGMARSLLFFFFSSMQSSVLGGVLAVVGFFFLFGMLLLTVRVFFTYIAGYMGVAFLIIFSPLFIPMILFRETKQYFDKWTKMLIAFAMQPVIMLVFIIFSLTAVDLALFSGNYSVIYQIAGDASRRAPFSLNDYLVSNEIIAGKDRVVARIKTSNPEGTPIQGRSDGGIVKGVVSSSCTPDLIKADPLLKVSCDSQYPVQKAFKNIDWEKMASVRKPPLSAPAEGTTPGQQISRQVMAALFFGTMVVFILNGLLALVPAIISDLLGDAVQSPDLSGVFGNNLGGGIGGGLSGIADKVTKPFQKAK
ncbi:MAG: type IV secretion system protein [Alphaproteobacteria bacterium]|nr:type IV secretion system protein [Alphaproteobacteria bacterium]